MNTKMKTKLFYGNQYVESFNCDGKKHTKFQLFKMKFVRFIKRATIVSGAISLFGWGVYVGSIAMPSTIYAEKQIIKEVQNYDIPVLNRIMQCESGSSHYDKNGQVLVRGNVGSRESVDVGIMQINSKIWGSTAKKLGYDLMKEQDNIAFGRWLFTNYGSEPWYLTKGCWNK